MSESKFTAPHLYFTQKVDLEKLLKLRKEVNAAQDKKTSVTDYIARATILALQKYPEMNASLVGDTIVKYKSVNLGIAVASPTGLIVPNIKDAQNLSVVELSKAASPLCEKARATWECSELKTSRRLLTRRRWGFYPSVPPRTSRL